MTRVQAELGNMSEKMMGKMDEIADAMKAIDGKLDAMDTYDKRHVI